MKTLFVRTIGVSVGVVTLALALSAVSGWSASAAAPGPWLVTVSWNVWFPIRKAASLVRSAADECRSVAMWAVAQVASPECMCEQPGNGRTPAIGIGHDSGEAKVLDGKTRPPWFDEQSPAGRPRPTERGADQ